jgi:fibronectin-binding autotransporter adhesin
LTNNVVADNQANTAGSGLYIHNSSPRLLHTTIARNSGGDGSGVHVAAGSVALTNTILVSHTAGIIVTAGNTATLESTLWHGNTTDWGGTGTIITGTHNYGGAPLFNADGYHLMDGSAAIDKGVDAGVTTDIDGETRPSGTGYDLGADEFLAAPALSVAKKASSDPVQAGEQLTYTISVTNTGNVDLHATVTDTLPDHVTPTGARTWTPTITAPDGVWTEQIVVTVTMGYSGTLTNAVQVTTDEGATDVYTHTCTSQPGLNRLYLPIILKNASP